MHEFGASNEALFCKTFEPSHLYWYFATAPAPSRPTRVRGRPSAPATLRIGRVGPGATATHLSRKAALASGLYAACEWVEEMFWRVARVRWALSGSVSHGVASIATIDRAMSLVVVLYHMRVGHEMPVGPYDEWLE